MSPSHRLGTTSRCVLHQLRHVLPSLSRLAEAFSCFLLAPAAQEFPDLHPFWECLPPLLLIPSSFDTIIPVLPTHSSRSSLGQDLVERPCGDAHSAATSLLGPPCRLWAKAQRWGKGVYRAPYESSWVVWDIMQYVRFFVFSFPFSSPTFSPSLFCCGPVVRVQRGRM